MGNIRRGDGARAQDGLRG